MKKLVYWFIVSMTVTSGCSNKKAFQYNDEMVTITESLQKKGDEVNALLKDAVNTRDFSKIDTFISTFNVFIEQKTTEIKNKEDVGGSEKFQSAMLELLRFEKGMVDSAFGPFTKMDSTTTNEEINTALAQMIEKIKGESAYLQKVQQAQADYASKNGFKIAPTRK